MANIRIIGFKTEYKGDRAIDWVEVAPIGENFDKVRTWHPVLKLMPPADWDETRRSSPTYIDMAAKWATIGPAYEAWKRGSEIPQDGTPLAAWSGLTVEQAALLRRMGIVTVENVRDMSEGAIAKLPFPGARQLPQLARDYLSGRGDAEKDQMIADMQERMAAMEEMLAEATQKRGPGRPRKDEAA